jgi:hypothetical protein
MYECNVCNYSNKLKSNYNRHNLSKRHIKNMKYHIDTINQTTTYTEYLGTTKKPRKTTNFIPKNHEKQRILYQKTTKKPRKTTKLFSQQTNRHSYVNIVISCLNIRILCTTI